MAPQKHVILSCVNAMGVYLVTGSVSLTAVCFVAGVLMDLDHMYDFLVSKPKSLLDLREFISGDYLKRSGKCYLFLHSYEIVIALMLLSATELISASTGLALGSTWLTHLLADQFSNSVFPWSFFLTYRIKVDFSVASIAYGLPSDQGLLMDEGSVHRHVP